MAMPQQESEREFYAWAARNEDGTERTEWYVLDSARPAMRFVDDPATGERHLVINSVAGPFDFYAAIKEAVRRNKEIGL